MLAVAAPLAASLGAPDGVLGVHEWRGRLLTVLDVTHFLDEAPLPGPHSLLRLAPPFERTALLLPGPVQLLRAEDANVSLSGHLTPHDWVDGMLRQEAH